MTKSKFEQRLTTHRRSDSVDSALHQRVMKRVAVAQRGEGAGESANKRWRPLPWLASAATVAALVVVIVSLRAPLTPTEPAVVAASEGGSVNVAPDGNLAALLEKRLTQPLDSLQALQGVNPLARELAALESDLTRLKPRWPWQAEDSPAG